MRKRRRNNEHCGVLRDITGYYGVIIMFLSRAPRALGAWQQASGSQGASPGPGERLQEKHVGRNPTNKPRGEAWRHRRAATGAAISQHEREALHRRKKKTRPGSIDPKPKYKNSSLFLLGGSRTYSQLTYFFIFFKKEAFFFGKKVLRTYPLDKMKAKTNKQIRMGNACPPKERQHYVRVATFFSLRC